MTIIKHRQQNFERASIDEAYIDLTDDVNKLMTELFVTLKTNVALLSNDDISSLKIDEWMELLSHQPPSSDHSSDRMDWVVRWISWIDQVDVFIKSYAGREPTLDSSAFQALSGICDVMFGCGRPIARLSSSSSLRSEVTRRVNGEPLQLKDLDGRGDDEIINAI